MTALAQALERTTPRGPERRIATHLSGHVLGAGMLVMPPVVAALAGRDGVLVWSAHILLGAAVSLLLAALVRTRVRPGSLAAAVGALLGSRARRTVDGVFALAFTLGQAAIAWFAATCLLTAADGAVPRPGTDALPAALGVLGAAVLAALSPLVFPAAVLRWRPWAAGAVALACAAYAWPAVPAAGVGSPLAPSGLSHGGAEWLALAALFFAGVGWEGVTGVVPTVAAGPGRTAAGVTLGAGAVAFVYLGLATVRRLADGATATGQGSVSTPLRWTLALATVLVLTSYCTTNVRTAAGIAARAWRADSGGRGGLGVGGGGGVGDGLGAPERPEPAPAKALVAAVGVACCAFACAGAAGAGAVPLLLLGPAAAALTGYGLAAAAAVRRGGPVLRGAGAVLLLMLASTAIPAVPILLGG